MSARQSTSARIRAKLSHPVIDADGHWLEPLPVFLEFLGEVGGQKMVDRVIRESKDDTWYRQTPSERLAARNPRPWWWGESTRTLDRATAMIPDVLHQRLDEFGIDFAIIYTSLGFNFVAHRDEELRRAACRALNRMNSEVFAPYRRRLTPAAVLPMFTPDEAIAELDYVSRELGMKAAMINNHIRRPIPAALAAGVDPAYAQHYIDPLVLDSEYDYDPLWARFIERGIAVTTHADSVGWDERRSPTNFTYNHIGHFAAGCHVFTKALVIGGVLRRFPDLKFAMLEGGAGWACNLLIDLIGHWEKRRPEALMRDTRPTNLDVARLERMFRAQGGPRYADKIDELMGCLSMGSPYLSLEEATARESKAWIDDFAANPFETEDELREQFTRQLFFGCEADDLSTVWAFDPHGNHRLKTLFSSDVGHFDVIEMNRVLEEAYELVEHEMISEAQFEEFTFKNIVELHTAMNPDFFADTVVADAVARLRARAD